MSLCKSLGGIRVHHTQHDRMEADDRKGFSLIGAFCPLGT